MADRDFGAASRAAIRGALDQGSVVACEVVWAELAGALADPQAAIDGLTAAGIRFSPSDQESAVTAGTRWRSYREAGGARDRMVADFLIAGHAIHHADRLLTRDRGFYRSYFEDLDLLAPG